MSVTWKAEQSAETYDVAVGVSTSGDIAVNNDAVRGRVTTHGLTDLELRVGAPARRLPQCHDDLPADLGASTATRSAFGARLEVTLPPQVTLVDISASNAICSGTTRVAL